MDHTGNNREGRAAVFRLLLASIAFSLLLTGVTHAQETFRVLVLADEDSRLHARFLDGLDPGSLEDVRITIADHLPTKLEHDLIISVGSRMAASIGHHANRPVIAAFLPLAAITGLQERDRWAFLPLDPDPIRFTEILVSRMPGLKQVRYVVWSDESGLHDPYIEAGKQRGLKVEKLDLSQVPFSGMIRRSAQEIDAVVILPDPELYRRKLIYQVMLNSFRKRIPAIGTTQNMYRAGAALTIHVEPEACGRMAREIIVEMARGAEFHPGIRYTQELRVLENRKIMSLLGMDRK